MKYPKFKRYALIALPIVLLAILILGRCMAVPAEADPTSGPPTIEQHLTQINANMQFMKYAAMIISGLIGLLIAAVVYAYKRDLAGLKGSIIHVEKNLKKDISEADRKGLRALEKTDHIQEHYLRIDLHDKLCKQKGGAQ
jgi:hypothetical protein